MREKRQHHRAQLNVPVKVVLADDSSWTTDSLDISVGGMFLEGQSMARIGTEVMLEFEMPTLGKVVMPAFIRWTSARGFGVQFGLIGPRETHAIGYLVRAHPEAV